MFLNEFKVLNLWGKNSIEIKFDDRVTILTGLNGSGKSSLLNIIYDSLKLDDSEGIATSKNRLWVSESYLLNSKVYTNTVVLPPIPSDKHELVQKTLNRYLKKKEIFTKEAIKGIEQCYEDKKDLNHVTFTKGNIDGQGIAHGIGYVKGTNKQEQDNLYTQLTNRPNAFIYQEDRKTMHNLENSNMDQGLEFWKTYSTSIDSRFFYIRDAMHILESRLDALRSDIIDRYEEGNDFDSMIHDEEYISISNSRRDIAKLYDKLNEYFEKSGKYIVKDKDDNKVTLASKETKTAISWHLLSRGEKTVIYLFFAIYLYKDKVSLFLLDEPDVALHVSWQEDLIKDLVALAPDKQFIFATHSPSLVMNGWMNNCKEIAV